jgi:transposase-like protein
VLEDMMAWQNRPLDAVYPVRLIDAILIKVRDTQVANRPVYLAMEVNLDGERDVLGFWMGPSGVEGAKQWMTMLTELRNRALVDALIVCCDGLKGLPDAIRVTWPDATVQTCVLHLVRNSLRYTKQEAPAADHQADAADPHRQDRAGGRELLRRLRPRVG